VEMRMVMGVVNVEIGVEIGVEIVMLKGLDLLVFLLIPNLQLFLLFPINLNLLLQLSFPSHYNFSL
jgi:hypothetical protein